MTEYNRYTLATHADTEAQLNALQLHANNWQATLSELFKQHPERTSTFSLEAAGLFLDYSKNQLTSETIGLLLNVAHACQLPTAIRDLLNGAPINNTEQRPALHTALRFHGVATSAEEKLVAETLKKMEAIVDKIHRGKWTGFNDQAITDVVNIGIGGSDLGPRMICEALKPYHHPSVRVHFVANVDESDLEDTLQGLTPATTLFIVASKSFTTMETLENATSARRWLTSNGCGLDRLHQHFIAISARPDKAESFGIARTNILPMWDWVGGRYSLWSAIGLPIALTIGMQLFNDLRAGAQAMDTHFANAPLDQNMPVLMALITYWYNQYWQAHSQAILPYCNNLRSFPQYLQQLDMESLGKSVNRNGEPLTGHSGLVIWGTQGTNGQHSFHQLLHQGTRFIPIDFIVPMTSGYHNIHQHQHLVACCISQSQALLVGKTHQQALDELLAQGKSAADAAELAPHQVVPGNRPSNTLAMKELTPYALGALTALYEHKVFSLGVLLGINPYDQWGVEIGKQLGTKISNALESGNIPAEWDSSTRELARRFLETVKY